MSSSAPPVNIVAENGENVSKVMLVLDDGEMVQVDASTLSTISWRDPDMPVLRWNIIEWPRSTIYIVPSNVIHQIHVEAMLHCRQLSWREDPSYRWSEDVKSKKMAARNR
jgi:hypothetical protein